MAVQTRTVADICHDAKRASRALAQLDRGTKDAALHAIADALIARTEEILEANARDMEAGREAGLSAALLDRLALDAGRVAAMADGVRQVAALDDPVGEVVEGRRLANGLDIRKVRAPLGVVAVVYEARPNVTIDAAALALKSGNAIVLRGSSSAAHSNAVLASIAGEAATGAGVPGGAVSLVAGGGREGLGGLGDRGGGRGAGRAGDAGGGGRPDHPARRRGAEGGAERGRDGAGDLRGVGQLPRVRGRERRPGRGRGDRGERQDAATGRVQRGGDAAGARRRGRRVPAAGAARAGRRRRG